MIVIMYYINIAALVKENFQKSLKMENTRSIKLLEQLGLCPVWILRRRLRLEGGSSCDRASAPSASGSKGLLWVIPGGGAQTYHELEPLAL